MDYIRQNYVYTRVVESLPWKSRDSNVKGDPRKSVKWIDVSYSLSRGSIEDNNFLKILFADSV
jgi:hypothetical protein